MRTQRTITPENALIRLQELCARSEQCSHEVLTRLRGWGIEGRQAAGILDALIDERYVDDSRYAAAFARDKVVFNRWGRAKVRMAMIQKRLDRDLIDEALAAIDPDEYSRALAEALRAKAASMPETLSYESRQKLLRHLVSRGFEAGMAVSVIKNRELWSAAD